MMFSDPNAPTNQQNVPKSLPEAWAAFSEKQQHYQLLMQQIREDERLSQTIGPLLDELHEGIQALLTTDPMTGCQNRGSLELTLATSADDQGRINGPYALMLLDVDDFKQINDFYGHQEGDRCLVDLARLLTREFEGQGTLFRLGGDEFLILLPGCSESEVRKKSEELRVRIKEEVILPSKGPLPLTVSMGLLVLQEGETALTSSELLEHVDLALYSSKDSGRDRCTLWSPHLPTEILFPQPLPSEEDPITLRIERDQAREYSVSIMSAILDAREFETSLHSERVTRITAFLLNKMEIPTEQRNGILQGARLHDIGKIAIPEQILHKQEALTESERHILGKHPEIGFRFVATCPFLKEASEVILHHHERWDGKGYPHGLAGREIPLSARIFSVVDTYDSMRANRVYRESIPLEHVKAELQKESGKQFDPDVVSVVLAHIPGIEAIGHWQEANG